MVCSSLLNLTHNQIIYPSTDEKIPVIITGDTKNKDTDETTPCKETSAIIYRNTEQAHLNTVFHTRTQ